jgi:hypothetical protein
MDKASELLAKFPDPDVILAAAYQPVEYDESTRVFRNKALILSVQRNGSLVPNFHNVLNEARLSAIGLVVYLAGMLTSVPTVSSYPKLLVLDDVLVGLDLANRLPVLSILEEYFADWQIILMTYDRVWYEMVFADLKQGDWRAYELWMSDNGLTPVHKPRDGDGSDFFLNRAIAHFAQNDDRASGMYARAAFETKVKQYCHNSWVPVPYQKPPKYTDSEKFWLAAKAHAIGKAPNPAAKTALETLFKAVDIAKKVVLNPLSHSAPPTITRPEIQAAITAVTALKFK